MADPRALHLQGLGTLDKVHADWLESAEHGGDFPDDVLVVIDKIYEILQNDKLSPIAVTMVISLLNSRLREHGRILRLSDCGQLHISDKLVAGDLDMFCDYIANV